MAELTPKRVLRLVRRNQISFERVVDTRVLRSPHQVRLPALLRLMVAAIACNRRKLRDAEAFSADMTPKMRRLLGINRTKVSDTALYEMLHRSIPYGFRQTVWEQIRRDLDSKAVTNDLFAKGVVSYDGKKMAFGWGDRPNRLCQTTFAGQDRKPAWLLFGLRATLTSSSARPVIDMDHFDNRFGEATRFCTMFRRDVAQFPRLFRYVTTDAGIISEDNAHEVLQAGKHYLFALKKNFKWLYRHALTLLNQPDVDVAVEYKEWYRGELVIRQLRRVSVHSDVFPGVQQFLHVTKTRIDRRGHKRVGVRLYVTSIPPDELTPKQLLLLPRLHWGIENGPNWTTDVVLDEDRHCPCKKRNGPIAMSWLNVIAYNLLAVFRAHLPKVDGWRLRWRRVCELVYQVMTFWELEPEVDAMIV